MRQSELPITYHGRVDSAAPTAADLKLARDVSDVLSRHYPGHGWMVHVDHGQGVVTIDLPTGRHTFAARIAGRYKGLVKISTLAADPSMRAVVRVGGMVLEAWRQPRAGLDETRFLEARPESGAFAQLDRAVAARERRIREALARSPVLDHRGQPARI